MKNLLLLLVLGMVIGFNQSASAQEYKSAIGLRLGYPLSVSYKTFLNDKAGNIGLDYKFANTPINLSLDWIPTYWLTGYYDGFGSAIGGLAVRYTF